MVDYERFLRTYYHDELLKIAGSGTGRLIIDYGAIENHDTEAAEAILTQPDKEIEKIKSALYSIELPIPDYSSYQCDIAFKNLPEKTPINRIGSRDTSHLLAVEGRINKIGDVKVKLEEAAFKCMRCTHVTHVRQPDDGKYIQPFECENDVCGRKGPFQLINEQSFWKNEKKIELQELYESLRAGQPTNSIIVVFKDTDMSLIETIPAIGAQVVITGILRTVQQKDSNVFKTILEALHIEAVEQDLDPLLTESDKTELQKLAAEPDILKKLVQSTAPSIIGYPEIKLALLMAAVSGNNQKLANGANLRNTIHIAICGDPGTGKTEMVEDIRRKIPRAQYAAGKQTTVAGLTVSAVKDELNGGGFVAQAGALVLADKSIMFLDEADKFEPEDLQALNTVMEKGSFEYHKGGINQTFNARCPIIAVGNPKNIRFDNYGKEDDLITQVDIPQDTLSRFDLIFKIIDIPDAEKDRRIAEHIDSLILDIDTPGRDATSIPISQELMQKYLMYAKTFEPKISEAVAKETTEYYVNLRQSGDGRIAATARDKYGIIRLTKAITKLRLSNVCTIEDVATAIEIHKASLEAIKDSTGRPDVDLLYGLSKSQRERENIVRENIVRENIVRENIVRENIVSRL
jgi:replicative DNA helicase Mcm